MPGTVTYNLNLTLSNATTLLPKIKATMNITVSNRVKIAKPGFHPIAMITAETNVNAINNNITTGGNGIKLVFTVHTAWINSISGKNSGRILNFHADINEVDLRQISGNNIVQNGNFYEITVYGNSFSSHGIVGQEEYAPGPTRTAARILQLRLRQHGDAFSVLFETRAASYV